MKAFLSLILGILLSFPGLSGFAGKVRKAHLPERRPPAHVSAFVQSRKSSKAEAPPAGRPLFSNAAKALNIPTPYGGGQANHPKVLFFAKGWHGWKYWMSYTPYPDGEEKDENPSIAVSNDGVRWSVPNGLKNPVVATPPDSDRGGYNSDPHLVMQGDTMELWFRRNAANHKGTGPNNHFDTIWRITSPNGVKWSAPRRIFNARADHVNHISPAILYENGVWKVWFTQFDGKLYYQQSADLSHWSTPEAADLKLPGCGIWHQDVIHTAKGYEIVFSAYRDGHLAKNDQSLYEAVSPDGLHFTQPVTALTPSAIAGRPDDQMIYRSSIVMVGETERLYYSAMDRRRGWHILLAP